MNSKEVAQAATSTNVDTCSGESADLETSIIELSHDLIVWEPLGNKLLGLLHTRSQSESAAGLIVEKVTESSSPPKIHRRQSPTPDKNLPNDTNAIQIEKTEEGICLVFARELNTRHRERLYANLKSILYTSKAKKIEVDLRNLKKIPPSLLGILCGAQFKLREEGVEVEVIANGLTEQPLKYRTRFEQELAIRLAQ